MDAAAAAIDAIPAGEINKSGNEPLRAPDGRFQKMDAEPVKAEEVKQPEQKQPDAKAKDDKADDAADDDEDYIELPPDEEGKEPARYKLSEVIQGYKKAQTLEQEIAKAREASPPPEIWDNQIMETVQARQQLMQNIAQWARLNQPQEPDLSLIDPNSINYAPETYWAQHKQYEALKQAHAKAGEQFKALEQQQHHEQEAIQRVRVTREAAKLEKIWPELKEKSTADKVYADLKQHYGLDESVINSVVDSRFFALAKDALAYRAKEAAAQTAAKIVSAKPKLIPGKARPSQTNGKAATYANAMGKLQGSHSVDDAASAIASLL